MRLLRALAAGLVILALTGCSRGLDPAPAAPKDAVTLAKKTVNDLRRQDMAALQREVSPRLAGILENRAMVRRVTATFPNKPPIAERVIMWGYLRSAADHRAISSDSKIDLGTISLLRLRYEYEGNVAVEVQCTIARSYGQLRVYDIQIAPLTAEVMARNAFLPKLQSFNKRHVFLLIAAGVLIFLIATSVTCIRMPELEYRWLWLVVIWLGTIQITMDWNTAMVFVKPFVLSFPPIWAAQLSPYDPVMIWFLLPSGAIGFRTLLMLRREPAPQPRKFAQD